MCSILYLALTWLKDNSPMDRPFQHQMCMHITGQGCTIHHIQWAVKRSLGFLNTFTTARRARLNLHLYVSNRADHILVTYRSHRCALVFSLVEIRRKDSRHWGKAYTTVDVAFLRDFIAAWKAQRLTSYWIVHIRMLVGPQMRCWIREDGNRTCISLELIHLWKPKTLHPLFCPTDWLFFSF